MLLPDFQIFVICLCLLPNWHTHAQPRKLALLVGISNYPASSGWKNLHSANDLALLKEVLIGHGYDVQLLEDGNATKQGILEALAQDALALQPGDLFHFHFSGHGQQVVDTGNDEFDGLDEALVPFDAKAFYGNGYTGQNHLLDDELRMALIRIREKIGPTGQAFVTLDACHSGTATRSMSVCRGTDTILAPPDFQPNDATDLDDMLDVEENRSNLAPIVVFSATSARQANWEFPAPDGKRYGPLSFALSKVMDEKPQTTFKGLFDEVRSEMAVIAPRQTPCAEGPINLVIGENKIFEQESLHFEVVRIGNKSEVQINGGLLQQIRPGTKLFFYQPDTWHPGKTPPIVSGIVSYSELIRADVELEAPIDKETIAPAWAFVAGQQLGDSRLFIQLHLPNHKALEDEFKNQLTDFPNVILVTENFDLLLEETEAGQFRLSTYDEVVLCEETFTTPFADAAYLLEEVILKFFRYKFLKELQYEDPWLKVSLNIIPANEPSNFNYDNGFAELEVGEQFFIEVTNKGDKACYINLLDIQPNAIVTPLVPGVAGDFQPGDLLLEPGQTKRLKSNNGIDFWQADLPLGFDILKLIATDEPIDLRAILAARGNTKEANPLLQAFNSAFSMQQRGAHTESLPSGAATVASVVIRIR
ncbi:MAG: caspase family protein [Saprospiraceae bacterium]